jgi:hypothetical protein
MTQQVCELTKKLLSTYPQIEHLIVDLYLVAKEHRTAVLVESDDYDSFSECSTIVAPISQQFGFNIKTDGKDILVFNNNADMELVDTCFRNKKHMGQLLGYYDPLHDVELEKRYLVSFIVGDYTLFGQVSSFSIPSHILSLKLKRITRDLSLIGINGVAECLCKLDDFSNL